MPPKYYTATKLLQNNTLNAGVLQSGGIGNSYKVGGSYEFVAQLCSNYGDLVNARLASQDVFYAIHPLLRMAAATEFDFLSIVESKIVRQIEG